MALFRDLDADEVADVQARSVVRQVNAGGEIPLSRHGAGLVCFCLHGSFRVTMMSPSGRVVVIASVKSGQHFGEISDVATPGRHEVTVVAETACEYLEVPAAALADLISAGPTLCHFFLRLSARASASQIDRIFELCTFNLRERLVAELLRLADEGVYDGRTVVIRPAPTHEVFASMLGGTREGVTREFKALAGQGLIQVGRKEISILAIERLRLLLSPAANDEEGADVRIAGS